MTYRGAHQVQNLCTRGNPFSVYICEGRDKWIINMIKKAWGWVEISVGGPIELLSTIIVEHQTPNLARWRSLASGIMTVIYLIGTQKVESIGRSLNPWYWRLNPQAEVWIHRHGRPQPHGVTERGMEILHAVQFIKMEDDSLRERERLSNYFCKWLFNRKVEIIWIV